MRHYTAGETSVFALPFSILLFSKPFLKQRLLFSAQKSHKFLFAFPGNPVPRVFTLTQLHTLRIILPKPRTHTLPSTGLLSPLGNQVMFQANSCSLPAVPQLGHTWALPPGSWLLTSLCFFLPVGGRARLHGLNV